MHCAKSSSTEIHLASLGVEDVDDHLPVKRESAARSGDTSSPHERIERKRRSIEHDCAIDGVQLRTLLPTEARAARFWHVRTFATEFAIIAPLGTGSSGRVELARRLDSAQLCAVKRVGKAHVLRHRQEVRLLNERICLRAFDNPFIVQ